MYRNRRRADLPRGTPLAPEEILLTEDEVAAMLAVSSAAVRKWRGEGRIRFVRLGSAVRYERSEVMDFIERGRQAPPCAECEARAQVG